jgi:hypothetical protein
MLASFLGVLPILTLLLCALAFIMCSKSNPIVGFALDLMSTYEGEHMIFGLLARLTSLRMNHFHFEATNILGINAVLCSMANKYVTAFLNSALIEDLPFCTKFHCGIKSVFRRNFLHLPQFSIRGHLNFD